MEIESLKIQEMQKETMKKESIHKRNGVEREKLILCGCRALAVPPYRSSPSSLMLLIQEDLLLLLLLLDIRSGSHRHQMFLWDNGDLDKQQLSLNHLCGGKV